MNRSARRTKRSTTREKPKKSNNKRSVNPCPSEMDVCFDDSNDSGFDVEGLMPNSRNCVNGFDQSSDDLDRDSSDDSIDSGIFGVSSVEEQNTLDGLSNVDARVTLLEDSGLANLLCQSISISEESKINSEWSEPQSKKRCILPPSIVLVENDYLNEKNTDLQIQMNGGASQINLLGIASQVERPQLTPHRSSSNNSGSLSTNQATGSRRKLNRKPPSLHVTYPNRLKDGQIDLRILSQPEEQHRARYMTEGSRGAIKDKKGSGFPTVKLFGYNQPVTLQVFIGTDQGKIQPHLFYQACKVSGKNCTPCAERIIDGTTVIEISMLPDKDMTVSCDCIGILKERNVDVEQRLPYFNMTRAKKKNTRCRMVFRVNLALPDSGLETLQTASSPILCTQPPGVPEICKKSIKECSAAGGTELFIIGKNFLKDTKIVFEEEMTDEENEQNNFWREIVDPEKEFLHQTHLVCRVPSYRNQGILEPTKVHLTVQSGGKTSESHTFTYLPLKQGLAVDNHVGNLQNLTSGSSRTVQIGRQLSRSHLMPTFIQVSGGLTSSTVPAIVVSQANGIVAVPKSMTRDTALRPNVSPQLGGYIQNKSLKSVSKVPSSQEDHSSNSNQIHVVVVQQNEKSGKRIQAVPANGNRFRSNCFPGKRYHRFGHRGKLINMSRGKFHTPRTTTFGTDTQTTSTAPMDMLKQELIGERRPVTSEMTTNSVDEQRDVNALISQAVMATATAIDQSSVFANQDMSPPIGETADQQLPLFPASASMTTSNLVDGLVQSQVFQTQSIEPHCLLSPNILSTQSASGKHVSTIDSNPAPIMQSDLLSVEIQSMMDGERNLMQQQNGSPLIREQNGVKNDPMLSQLSPSIEEVAKEVTNNMTNDVASLSNVNASPAECQSLQMKTISNDLCQSLGQNDLIHIQGRSLCSSFNQNDQLSNDSNRSEVISSAAEFNPQVLKHEVLPEEFLQSQNVCRNRKEGLPVVEILCNADIIQENSLSVPVKTELDNSIRTSITQHQVQQSNQLNQISTVACTDVPVLQRPSLQQEQQIMALATSEGSELVSINHDATPNISQTMKTGSLLELNLLQQQQQQQLRQHIQQLQQQQQQQKQQQQQQQQQLQQEQQQRQLVPHTSQQTLTTQQQQQQQNGGLVAPSLAELARSMQLSKGINGGVVDVKREKQGSSDQPQCEMDCFQSTMTSALSMLSESDLLSLINPSTFDNL